MAIANILVGSTAAVLAGRSALPAGRGLCAAAVSEDFVVGLSFVVPVALAWGLAGLPWGVATMPSIALAFVVLWRVARRWRSTERASPGRAMEKPGALSLSAEALLGLCFLVALWKWLRVPLWSWDHFAIWGLKARRIVEDSAMDLRFLGFRRFITTNPGYPIGLPLAWRLLSPGEPSAADFKLCHLLFAAGLASGVHGAARRLGSPRSLAALTAAAVCASPLFWDTEAVGLADLPLASVAVVSLLLTLDAHADPDFPAWPAGVGFGFLSWIKTEGLLLGTLLAVAGSLLVGAAVQENRRFRRRASLLVPWLLWSLGAIATHRLWLPPGVGFFMGDWKSRVLLRANDGVSIVTAVLRNLEGSEWLGLWFLFAAAAVYAFCLRKTLPALLSSVVAAQMMFYTFVYFGTYFDPLQHVKSSFHRLASALAPLAALAVLATIVELPDGGLSKPKDGPGESDGSNGGSPS